MKKITIFATILILNTIFTMPVFGQADEMLKNFQEQKKYSLINEERIRYFKPDEVTKALAIKPDMSILDIGAGLGIFTFRFADALQGTGKVYATEINPGYIKYIEEQKKAQNLNNIETVIVSPDGLDPFYKKHKFDIIFAAYLYYYLKDPQEYFRELLPSLKDNGYIYILQPSYLYFFHKSSFLQHNLNDFINVIKKETNKMIFNELSDKSKQIILNWDPEKIPDVFLDTIIDDFNNILKDRNLFPKLMKYYLLKENLNSREALKKMSTENYSLIQWLAQHLDDENIFFSDKKLSELNKERLNRLNSLILNGIFSMNEIDRPLYYLAKKNAIIRTLESCGYTFIKEFDIIDFSYFLKFKKTKK